MDLAAALLDFLAAVPIQAHRLHLDTGPVRATVPQLRGVWGAALHDLHPDVYTAVFDPPGGTPAYILRPAPPAVAPAPAVEWILLPGALPWLQPLWRAWDVASGMGLGPDRDRFHLRRTVPLGPDGGPRGGPAGWPLSEVRWPLPDPVAPCRLRFPAPLRLMYQGKLVDRPTLTDLVVAAARRVEAWVPGDRQAAWRDLQAAVRAQARASPAEPWQGGRLDLHRWSGRQAREIDLRGVAGHLDLPAGPGPLWPLVAAAQLLHLGKGTVMGLGQVLAEPRQPGEPTGSAGGLPERGTARLG